MSIVIVGGFATPRVIFAPLERRLRLAGQRTAVFSHHVGLDCSEATYTSFRRFLQSFEDTCGEPATIIAYSRGGQIAKVAAVRAPVDVHAVVALGAPFAPGVENLGRRTRRKILTLGKLGSIGVPGVVSSQCLAEHGCCQRFWEDLSRPWPNTVHVRTIYARHDSTVRPCTPDNNSSYDPIWVDGNHYQLLTRPGNRDLAVDQALLIAPRPGTASARSRDVQH